MAAPLYFWNSLKGNLYLLLKIVCKLQINLVILQSIQEVAGMVL